MKIHQQILFLYLTLMYNCSFDQTKNNLTTTEYNSRHSSTMKEGSDDEKTESKSFIVDNLEQTNFTIKMAGTTSIIIGDSTLSVVNAFGTPTSISNYYSEMEEQDGLLYEYGNSKFYFIEGRLRTFTVTSTNFIFSYGTNSFKVGDNLPTIAPIMPNYASNKKTSTTYAHFVNGAVPLDTFLLIKYHSSTEKISEVSIHTF